MDSFRDSSRASWTSQNSIENVNAGSLQRIADSCELIAKNYQELIEERNRYKLRYEDKKKYAEQLEKTIYGLRGQITKLNKKINKLSSTQQ